MNSAMFNTLLYVQIEFLWYSYSIPSSAHSLIKLFILLAYKYTPTVNLSFEVLDLIFGLVTSWWNPLDERVSHCDWLTVSLKSAKSTVKYYVLYTINNAMHPEIIFNFSKPIKIQHLFFYRKIWWTKSLAYVYREIESIQGNEKKS